MCCLSKNMTRHSNHWADQTQMTPQLFLMPEEMIPCFCHMPISENLYANTMHCRHMRQTFLILETSNSRDTIRHKPYKLFSYQPRRQKKSVCQHILLRKINYCL